MSYSPARYCCLIALALIFFVCCILRADAPTLKTLQFARIRRAQLQTMFGVYGPPAAVSFGPGGVMLWCARDSKQFSPIGLYSNFALAGDFEITLTYNVSPPRGSARGVSGRAGLALDAEHPVWHTSIEWGSFDGRGLGYALSNTKADEQAAEEDKLRFVPSRANKGRIGLRRHGEEIVFLAAPNNAAPLSELERMPFTSGAIRTVRFFANVDPSGREFRATLSNIELHADEITGGVPADAGTTGRWWWLAVIPLLVVTVGIVWLRRRRVLAEVD